jgi:hypothetical protein
LWRGYLQDGLPPVLVQAALLDAWLIGALLAFRGTAGVNALVGSAPVRGAGQYLIAGSTAFLVVYILSPGYVYGGYLSRYAPLPVFVTDVALALMIYLLLRLVARPSVALRGWPTVRAVVIAVLAGELLVFVVAYWVRLQVTYVTNMPPDGAAFLQQLEAPTFQHAGIVSNNYALPIALATNSWAYQDEMISQRRPVDVERQQIAISGKYMWFRDRDSNPDYVRPRYYVCRTDRNLDTVADLLTLAPGQHLQRCSGEPLVKQAIDGPDQLVASDQGRADMWAVVALAPGTSLHPTWREGLSRALPVYRLATYALRTGFYDSEGVGKPLPRWTSGRGVLELYPEAPGDFTLVLDLVQPDFGTPRPLPDLTISADGRTIPPKLWRVEQPAGGHYTLQVPIGVRPARGRPVVVTLQSWTFVPAEQQPGNTDQRQLGVRLEGIRIEESQ